jgi:hypothetical protein
MAGSLAATNLVMSRQAMWLDAIEKRIAATTTMLSSMKGVKMSGLTETMSKNVHGLRMEELRISRKFRKLLIWNMGFSPYHYQQFLGIVLTLSSIHNTCSSSNSYLCGVLCHLAQQPKWSNPGYGSGFHLTLTLFSSCGSLAVTYYDTGILCGFCWLFQAHTRISCYERKK